MCEQLTFFDFSGSVVVLKLVASVIVGCMLLLGSACCITDVTETTTDPLASELADWFEFSFPMTVGVRAPVFLFLVVWVVVLPVDELDLAWPMFLCIVFGLPTFVFIAEAVAAAVAATAATVVATPSCPNTLSDCVTIVSTKLEVVNLLELVELSLGVLRPLLLLSSATPFISKLGLAFDLLLEFVVDLELELFRLPLDDLTGISASFSGDESDEPLSAGMGL